MKIISGGQTGADRGALIAARKLGFETGGWMPYGFKAQDGKHPEFKELYGMSEHASPHYPPRTALNVKESDATVRIAMNFESSGEVFTLKMIYQYKKPHFDVNPLDEECTPEMLANWLREKKVKILNIAGNSERSAPGIQEFADAFIYETLEILR